MIKFKLRYCRVLMARYVSGDLSDAARRRVARYIDECEDCYREYMRHREFTQRLDRNLPIIGRPDAARLAQVWARLQDDLQAPKQHPARLRDSGTSAGMSFSYGVALVAISIAILVPLMLGYHSAVLAVDLPRVPIVAGIANTPETDSADDQILLATARGRSNRNTPLLQNTPAPRF